MRKEDIQRFNKFVDAVQGKVAKGDYEFMALCPAHGDARLSLWIKLDEKGKIHTDCKAGCSAFSVCESLGFDIQILYAKPQIVACYDYINLDGEMVYQEVKFDSEGLNKFKVRRKDKKKNEWIYDIKGIKGRILYNLFQLTQAADGEIIFMNEGAKDAKTLLGLGLTATAALFNDWAKTDTSPLDGKDVIVMVDNDDAGETKALAAAHDRYRRSKSIKLLRLPGLGKGGDVTDWLNKGGDNTKAKLLELAMDANLLEWFPQISVRERVDNKEMTGLAYEHNDPRSIWQDWIEIFHPVEEGPLYFYDDSWLKGIPQDLIYQFVSENRLLEQMTQLLLYCYNRQSKDSDEPFKPTPKDVMMVLKTGEFNKDLDVLTNPSTPIFIPFFMAEKEKNYKQEDIVVMKSANFYIPERCVFPRNMEACIALHALPFDYDVNAKCPEIEKSFNTQWPGDELAVNLFLQFLYYCMLHDHRWNSILCLIGASQSGKSKKLELIRHFIGESSCQALSLGKIGNQFELHRARNAKLLICDDLAITKRDLSEGSIVENLKSIPAGGAIRIERKGGEVYSRILPCQIIMAGNNPPIIPELSNALSNRFKFLAFNHIYVSGKDMNTMIIDEWIKELAGLMNLVLDAGLELVANDGFTEPTSSVDIREKFETGGNKILPFVRRKLELRTNEVIDDFYVTLANMRIVYVQYCEEEGANELTAGEFGRALSSISGISKGGKHIAIKNVKTGGSCRKWVRCWLGCKLKDEILAEDKQSSEPAF